ncbi:hypothetical protein F4694_003816 [Bacillus niacini]|uniref:Uncharacterized protein n=1 Tax=Neobacillus niacini TaxID=86668 RepID=A0A852TFR0_9BACI|nr:hypothetical protein [Neobacillus niacini]
MSVVYLISFSIFYVVDPYWIDLQIENKVGYLQMHLEQQYPEVPWVIAKQLITFKR